jgi:hypothetical protein
MTNCSLVWSLCNWTGNKIKILKIFCPKNCEKILSRLTPNTSICKRQWKNKHIFGFQCNRPFYSPNSDHNIGSLIQDDEHLEMRRFRGRCYDFLKYFRRKNRRKNWRFWLKTKLNYAKFWSWHWFLRKKPIFSPKIVENRIKLWT